MSLSNRLDFGVEYSPLHGGLVYLRRRQVIFSVVRSFSGCVLDAGCGRGRYASEIIKRGAGYYIGIDLDRKSLLKAKKFCNNKTNFLLGSLENLPLKGLSFDFVFCSKVIEHLKEPIRVFREMFRVMKRRGILLLSLPSQPISKFVFLLLMNRFGRLSVKYFMSQEHLREYAKRSFTNLFEAFSSLWRIYADLVSRWCLRLPLGL